MLIIYHIPRRHTIMQVDRERSYVSVMHGNGLKERKCLILERKGRKELSCSLFVTLEDASVSDSILTSPEASPLPGMYIYIFYELLL